MGRVVGAFLVVLALTGWAGAGITQVDIVGLTNLGVSSDYQANPGWQPGNQGVLTWSSGVLADIYLTDDPYWVQLDVAVSATWGTCTDSSAGGVAQADFRSGSFAVDLFPRYHTSPGEKIGTVTGHLYTGSGWTYNEAETSPDFIEGRGLVVVDNCTVTVGEEEYCWQGGEGDLAGMTTSTQLDAGRNLQSYLEDWASPNTIVTLLADESGIPEPATLGLLGLGTLGLLRRKR